MTWMFKREINGKTLALVQNSIIEEKVEAIINAANENLNHGGGVAGLISRTGGPEIQDESNLKAPIPTGTAVSTTAGQLPFTCIIHAVGPIWQGGTKGEEVLLKSAVLSALKTADQLKLRSLSLPAISTGIFGYPLKPAVVAIVQTIVDFLNKPSTLREVHLCEYSPQKAKEMKKIFEEIFFHA